MQLIETQIIQINNGKILYTKTKSKQAVSKKLLLSTLNEYFKDDNDTAMQVANHILDSRGEKITESIRRKDIK